MQAVNPLTLLLLTTSSLGYIALSLWLLFVNKKSGQIKSIWTFLIIVIPFLGSTIYFVNYLLIEFDKVPSSKFWGIIC